MKSKLSLLCAQLFKCFLHDFSGGFLRKGESFILLNVLDKIKESRGERKVFNVKSQKSLLGMIEDDGNLLWGKRSQAKVGRDVKTGWLNQVHMIGSLIAQLKHNIHQQVDFLLGERRVIFARNLGEQTMFVQVF